MWKLGKTSASVVLLVVFLSAGVLSAFAGSAHVTSSGARVQIVPSAGGAVPTVSGVATSTHAPVRHLAMTFPRTVLVETFTGIWCPHCPAETQALWQIDGQTSHNVVAIAELHVCAFGQGTTPCYDNYPAPDNTSYTRGVYYNVCGYPHVFFDGNYGVCGATNSQSQMYAWYEGLIANASAYPGNVSISQTALLSGTDATVQANISSGVTGTYNVVSYLMEYIGKTNLSYSSGPHDVAWVVRSTLHNHPAALVAGQSTDLNFQGALLSSWNNKNLSVVTFVQDNTTKVIQNTNFAPVTSEVTRIGDNVSSVNSGANSTVSVTVTNSTTGTPVAGADVAFSSDNGGAFTPSTGVTSGTGQISTTFTAPSVTSQEPVTVTATVTDPGYTTGTASTVLLVNPLVAPSIPTNLGILPGVGQATINWSAPTTGGGGVTYLVYQALARGGPFTVLTNTRSTNYTYTGLVAGQVLWFEVASQTTGGTSAKTAPVSATSVGVTPSGLHANNGWWIAIGLWNFSSTSGSSMAIFLPVGTYTYNFGAASLWIVGLPGTTDTLYVGTSALTLTVQFAPKPGTLEGTVSPASATVTFNGTALASTGGSFTWIDLPGTYRVVASLNGYTTNATTVKLTAGNMTTIHLQLSKPGSNTGALSSPTFGLLGGDPVTIIALAAIVVVAAVLGTVLVVQQRRKGRSPPPAPPTEPEYTYGSSPPTQ